MYSPYGIISDAASLIGLSDGVIVVAKFNETRKTQLQHTLDSLYTVNANILGTVLTHFDFTKSSDYTYGNDYYKYTYEGYEAYQNTQET